MRIQGESGNVSWPEGVGLDPLPSNEFKQLIDDLEKLMKHLKDIKDLPYPKNQVTEADKKEIRRIRDALRIAADNSKEITQNQLDLVNLAVGSLDKAIKELDIPAPERRDRYTEDIFIDVSKAFSYIKI